MTLQCVVGLRKNAVQCIYHRLSSMYILLLTEEMHMGLERGLSAEVVKSKLFQTINSAYYF